MTRVAHTATSLQAFARQPSRGGGFTLVEVAMAIVVGLVVAAAGFRMYQSVRAASKVREAQMIVGVVQTNVGMDKFRLGTPPLSVATTPSPYASVFGVSRNTDSTGRPYHPNGTSSALPPDPISGLTTVLTYDSAATPVPLVSNAPTPQWDNPVFLTAGPSPGYGNGGWLYDASTGAFRINYSNQQYPAERPGQW